METYSMILLPGRVAREPWSGREHRTQIEAYEICDRENDRREYVIVERLGVAHTVRRETIRCASYMGSPENYCGKDESTRAFALARQWAREASETERNG